MQFSVFYGFFLYFNTLFSIDNRTMMFYDNIGLTNLSYLFIHNITLKDLSFDFKNYYVPQLFDFIGVTSNKW